MLNTAHSLRQYLRREPDRQAASFAEVYRDKEVLSAADFERMLALHLEKPEKVTAVFDLDFDKQQFSVAGHEDGWTTYTMKDVSTAAYHAYRNGNSSLRQKQDRLASYLEGREITSAGHLSARDIVLTDEICEMDGHRLNFYLEASFDVDAVFGTHVCTEETDDTLNVYADYDMAAGEVGDLLEVDLHRADRREESLEYRLNVVEKATLLRKMDDYCRQQTGQSLKDYSAGLMAEEEIALPAGPTL